MAELDRRRITAVFAADPYLELRAGLAATLDADADQFSHTLAVDHRKRVLFQDTFCQVCGQDLVDVVARKAERSLREIVGSEAEELRLLGDLVGDQRGARQLDHRAHQVMHVRPFLGKNFLRHAAHDRCLVLHLFQRGGQRDHDLGMDLDPFLGYGYRSLEDGARLHLRDLWISDAQPATAVPQHGIELVQLFHAPQQSAQLLELGRVRLGGYQHCDLHHQILALRQELVQGRIQQADGHRELMHLAKESNEVHTLHGQQFLEGCAAVFLIAGQDHGPHVRDAILGEEHVLGAAQAYALGPELTSLFGIPWDVGIGTYTYFAEGFRPTHELHQKRIVRRWVCGFELAFNHAAGGAVEREPGALFKHLAPDPHFASSLIDLNIASARYAALTHATRDYGSMTGHATARSQNAGGNFHAVDIFRRSFRPHQDDRVFLSTVSRLFHSFIRGEHDLSNGRARRSRQSLRQD